MTGSCQAADGAKNAAVVEPCQCTRLFAEILLSGRRRMKAAGADSAIGVFGQRRSRKKENLFLKKVLKCAAVRWSFG